ncbi:MAG: methyltransferase domain-containing protein, partial [Anaerolinea sp.]|nr:methyltransferase domain-containing protein [Anaerolinea sp.]
LLDYSLSQLQFAQEHLGRSPRYIYVAADAYHLPFQSGIFDCTTIVRVLHHMSNVAAVLDQIRRVMSPGGTLILEHANKRNIKAILRYAFHQQDWNPYDLSPVEFVELNFDFHPDHIVQELTRAGFDLQARLPVSFFRLQTLKDKVPLEVLVGLDNLLQATGALYSPSIFTKSSAAGSTPDNTHHETLFACPECGGDVVRSGEILTCRRDGRRWAVRDGIYDFKAPIEVDD